MHGGAFLSAVWPGEASPSMTVGARCENIPGSKRHDYDRHEENLREVAGRAHPGCARRGCPRHGRTCCGHALRGRAQRGQARRGRARCGRGCQGNTCCGHACCHRVRRGRGRRGRARTCSSRPGLSRCPGDSGRCACQCPGLPLRRWPQGWRAARDRRRIFCKAPWLRLRAARPATRGHSGHICGRDKARPAICGTLGEDTNKPRYLPL